MRCAWVAETGREEREGVSLPRESNKWYRIFSYLVILWGREIWFYWLGWEVRIVQRRRVVFVLVLLAALAGGIFYWHTSAAREAAAARELTLMGNVDVREVSLAFRQSDRIQELLVDAGATVEAGQVLARLDSRELTLTMQKTRSEIRAQESALLKLQNGTRGEEVRQAEASLRAARAAAANAAGVYARKQAIYDSVEGISEQEVESARHEADARSAEAKAAEEKLAEAENGARAEDVEASKAQLQALNDELAREAYLLTEYELRAPQAGVIRSRLLEAGDMAGPSAPVFKLSLLDKKWVRVYVSEAELGRVYEGQPARVYIDSRPDAPLAGEVGYIASTAEFTPKTVQTEELRTALVYEVRVYVTDEENVLRLGMPATVKLDL